MRLRAAAAEHQSARARQAHGGCVCARNPGRERCSRALLTPLCGLQEEISSTRPSSTFARTCCFANTTSKARGVRQSGAPERDSRAIGVAGSSDKLLIYLTLYISACLRKLESAPTLAAGQKAVFGLAMEPFALPGDAAWPLGGLFTPPATREEGGASPALAASALGCERLTCLPFRWHQTRCVRTSSRRARRQARGWCPDATQRTISPTNFGWRLQSASS